MLVMSLYLVPLPPGHVGARARSSIARMNADFIVACEGLLVSEAIVAVLAIKFATELDDVSFDDAISDSLFSGQTTFGSQAFFEQHPLNPVDWQA